MDRFKKYNYLLRLILIICMALMIPFIIMGYLVVQNTYEDMILKNNDYYLEATYRFSNYFDEQIAQLSKHAINLSLSRKILRGYVEQEPWNTIEAVTMTLRDLKIGLPQVKLLGVHFYDSDYVLTSGYKYNLDYFLKYYSGNEPREHERFMDFLVSGDPGRPRVYSNFSHSPYQSASLFIGIPVRLESSVEQDAVFFYAIGYNSLGSTIFNGFGNDENPVAIFGNHNNLIFTNGYVADDPLTDDKIVSFLETDGFGPMKISINETDYTLYKWYNENYDILIVSFIPEVEYQRNISIFYKTLRKIMVIVLLIILAVIALTVYLSYQPVLRLFKRIHNYSPDDYKLCGELELIGDIFDKINREKEIMLEIVSEQRMYLTDNILWNLLDGISISEEKMLHLEKELGSKQYCIVTVLGLTLSFAQKGRLEEEIFKKCGQKIHITDIPFEKHMIFLCCYEDEQTDQGSIACIKDAIGRLSSKFKIAVGNNVSHITEIRKSYLNSLSVLEANAGTIYYDELTHINSSIDKYPYVIVMSFLQNVKNGEGELALENLSSIVNYVLDNVISQTTEKYICYDVLTSYVNALRELQIVLEREKSEELLSFTNLNTFHGVMKKSVAEVCGEIQEQKLQKKEMHKRKIIEYVDENFSDSEISLIKLADEFNVSIYTMSRLFKDITQIGFKEYVIIKRIDKSKHLLTKTDMPIKAISSAVGFNNPAYFTQIFKSFCGVAPSKFRK